MYKQSPNRHHRSKGIKVKHILQICVLVAVCFWLLYQIKHSHDKKKEYESKDDKVVGKLEIDSELQRIGRKDIPRVMDITTNAEKHGDNDDDDDEKEDEEDKENNHEEDETEKEDTRVGEREDERGGDDDIDEHEPEKTEEDEVDEDKKREEKGSGTEENHIENEENEDTHEEGHPEEEEEESGKEVHTESEESDDADKDDHGEREITSEDHDRDLERNTRKAQEELYKADDASSEVTHNVQSVGQENENATLGQANQIYGTINFGQDQETKTSDNVDKSVKPELQPREDVNNTSISSNKQQQQQPNLNVNNTTASNATIIEQTDDKAIMTKADDSSFQNTTILEIPNNSTVGGESIAVSFLSNRTENVLDDSLSQNGTVGANQSSDEMNRQETRESASKSVNVNTNNTLASSNAANDNEAVKDAKDSLVGDGSEGKLPEDTAKAGTDEDSALHSSEGKEAIQDTSIDASSTAILAQKERESRIDLDTLPEIKSEVHDPEDTMAE